MSTKTKVVFLDIDGVLNTFQGEMYHALQGTHRNQAQFPGFDHKTRPHDFHQWMSKDWCPVAISNLRWLLMAVPELKIVVSSVWRYGHTNDDMRWLFVHYPELFNRCIGRTVSFDHGIRGREIQHYLDNNSVDDFVIIDDDADMEHLLPKLVQTNGLHGMTYEDMEKALKILNVDRNAFSEQWHKTIKEK
jgi:hypothetical protein